MTRENRSQATIRISRTTFDWGERRLVVEGIAVAPVAICEVIVSVPQPELDVAYVAQRNEESVVDLGDGRNSWAWRIEAILAGQALPQSVRVSFQGESGQGEHLERVSTAADVVEVTSPRVFLSSAVFDRETRNVRVLGWAVGVSGNDKLSLFLNGQPFGQPRWRERRDVEQRFPWLAGTRPGFEAQEMVSGSADADGVVEALLVRNNKWIGSARLPLKAVGATVANAAKLPRHPWLGAVLSRDASGADIKGLAKRMTPRGRRRLLASRAFQALWCAPSNPAAIMRRAIVETMIDNDEIGGLLDIRLSTGHIVAANPNEDQVIARRFLLDGGYENGVIDILRRLLPRGGTALDVGSCYGHIAMAMAQAVGRDGQVVAVEGNPAMSARLAGTFGRNCIDNIEIIPAAVGAQSGEGFFYPLTQNNVGGSRVISAEGAANTDIIDEQLKKITVVSLDHAERGSSVPFVSDCGHLSTPIRVPMTTLDEIIGRTEKVPDVMKMDIEGSELLALRGAKKLISGAFGKQPAIIVEYSLLLPMLGGTREDLYIMLEGNGYRAHRMSLGKGRGGELTELKSMDEAPEHDDLVFLPLSLRTE
ncbi:FkbM family methyltransferase [Xanthobacter agilis]|uniref:FkbM family methyltransferase n=1 Tax=Xanthobacter agilis TaxID=47492 RepID=A0ABU0LHL1_XANAG|nr:FkbM family methyltransferase [Xanthobacter agilis]MDQ0506615.1 FkbM family methyltransferase [Xanthobacter agilis]